MVEVQVTFLSGGVTWTFNPTSGDDDLMNEIETLNDLFKNVESKQSVYNMKPEKTCVVTFENYDEAKFKKHRSHNTDYVCIECLFLECDGVKISNQKFNLQITQDNGFPPLHRLMMSLDSRKNVTVRLVRTGKTIFTYTVIDTDINTNTDTDTNIDIDRNLDILKDTLVDISKDI